MKLVLKKQVVFLLFSVLITSLVFGQGGENPHNFAKMVDFLPPAPNAASIIRYGGIGVSKNTGAPNVNIPITSIASNKLSTAISIGYSSTGIKVDEIASRVGMGWAIMAGGVITRTVRGAPDDVNTRLIPYATVGANMSTYTYMDRVANSYAGGFDGEPDLFNFNFNGYSGKFVFDENMIIVPVEPNKFKYEYNFTSTSWNFKITTTDGVMYYFGGSSATEKTKRDQVCGKLFDVYTATSWYLKEIVHPNGDKITFTYTPHEYTYDNGVSQTMYYTPAVPPSDGSGGYAGDCATQICSNPAATTCINLIRTQGVLLSTITAPQNQEISFQYISRTDCADKLISTITLSDIKNGSVPIKVWNFNYQEVQSTGVAATLYASGQNKTPYLTSFVERSPDASLTLQHSFLYNDMAGRPSRLSYAQDHWGYYNGKNNSTLIPKPESLQEQLNFPTATAVRTPDFKYASKGLLCKIFYPTGGIDTILYESNQVYKSVSNKPKHKLFLKVTGTGTHDPVVKEQTFTIDSWQILKLDLAVNTNGSGTVDPAHNKGTIIIKAASSSTQYLNKVWVPINTSTEYVELAPGSYKISVQANGTIVTTRATMEYAPTTITTSKNEAVGGVRVKTVMTASNNEKPMIKRYYYGEISTLNNSSLYDVPVPIYLKNYKTRQLCFYNNYYFYLFCERQAMYSGSLHSLFDFQSSPVSYASVVESHGDNLENGGIQTKFYSAPEVTGQVLWGDPIMNAPKSNSGSLLNGKVKEEIVYKRTASKLLIPLKKTEHVYKLDTRVNQTIRGYTINQKYANSIVVDTTCNPSTNAECLLRMNQCLDAFDMTAYDILCRWVYVESTTETAYDQNGTNPQVATTNYFYDDTRNLQLSKTESYDSKGSLKRTQLKYPHDYTGTTVYDNMITRNIIAPVIDVQNYLAGTKISEAKTNYSDWSNGNFLPSSVEKSTLSNPLESEGQLSKYDAIGNILEFTGRDGVVTSVLYGYKNHYPVAKIVGATYNSAKAQLSIDTSALQSLDGTDLLTELNRIRTNLTSAQVTTFTFTNSGLLSTITDLNNKKSRYEYDGLNRLILIRDLDSNIMKKVDYSYTLPDLTRNVNIFFNEQKSGGFYSQNCVSGFVPKATTYIVPAGTYFSYESQQAANDLATAEVNTQGQVYANTYGECSMTCEACTPLGGTNGYKCINETCELGQLTFDYDTWSDNMWHCHFYYIWSDGSTGGQFTIDSPTECGWD